MAYKKTQTRILAGSVNLHPPGDLLPESDAQDIQNFAYDSAGNLRSRKGHSLTSAIGSPIHSQIKALTHRWQGASTALWKAGVSNTTGFDGEALGLAAYQRWLWVMNRQKQGKHDGTNFREWAITAPAAKCTAAAGTEFATTITTFDNSETWTADPTGDNSFDGTDKVEGTHSLKFVVPEDKTYTATRTVTLNLSTVGGVTASDDDLHRIYVYCNKFKKLDSITIQLDCGDGTFNTDYYSAILSRKHLKKVRKQWKHFKIRKRLRETDSKKLPHFERSGSTAGKDWSTIVAIRVILDARAACTVRFDKWEVFGSTSAAVEGDDIQYYFTYVNDDGHESNPSPVSDAVKIEKQAVNITGLTASVDPQVTGKHLYRSGGDLPGVYRVTATPIANATTTYTDTSSDDTLTARGDQIETDLDAPPAARVLAGPYLTRLLAANTATHKARMFWSKLLKPYAFPGAALDEGNWVDIGDTGEEIVQMVVRPRVVFIYKDNSIWRMIGDPDDTSGEVEETRAGIGLIGANGVCKAGPFDYLHSKDGLFRFDGDLAVKISDKLDPIFKGLTTTLATGVTIPPISAANRANACLGFKNDRLYFSYPEEGQTQPNVTVVLNIQTGNWVRDSRGFRSIYNEGQTGELLGGTSAGDLVGIDNGTTDNGTAISLVYHSRRIDANLPDHDKTWEDFTIEANTGNQVITVTAYLHLDSGDTSVALGTVQTTNLKRVVLSFNGALGSKARSVSIRLTCPASAVVDVRGMALNYYAEARQAKSFDTDETDFGTVKAKEIRELKIDLDNPASVTLKLFTDHPGEAMAQRGSNVTIALSSTRRMAHVMFAQDYQAFLGRLTLSGSDFRVYSMRALIQVLGTFLLGGKSEFYNSDEIDFGTERIKLIREVEIVYKSTGNATFNLYCDQPGGVITTPQVSRTLSSATEQKAVKIRVPGEIWGRMFMFTVVPTADFQLETIRVRLKTIGEPNASSWVWVPLPIEGTEEGRWVDIPLPVDEVS